MMKSTFQPDAFWVPFHKLNYMFRFFIRSFLFSDLQDIQSLCQKTQSHRECFENIYTLRMGLRVAPLRGGNFNETILDSSIGYFV